jgi:hypothetical protein
MSEQEEHDRQGTMSLDDMKSWLADEIRDTEKARDLRINDAKQLVDDYVQQKITPEEVLERLTRHDRRWGEALFGTIARDGATDSEILNEIDRARDEQHSYRGFGRGGSHSR